MQSADNPDLATGRLVANSRPVDLPAAPRRAPISRSPAQLRKHDRSKTRPKRSSKAKPTPPGREATGSKVTVGGLNISVRMLAAFLIVAVIAIVLVPTLLQWGDMQRERSAAILDAETALAQEERLLAELENWENPAYVSAQARARLGYVDPGETRYSVVDAPLTDGAERRTEEGIDWPPKPWNLQLQEQLVEIDRPPAVKQAAQVETVNPPEEDMEDGW